MWRDDALLLDILDSSRRVLEFSADADYRRLQKDTQLYSAILYQLMIVGEAANKTSQGVKRSIRICPGRNSSA